MIKIRNRYTGALIKEVETLENADLRGVNLWGADLRRVNLWGADFRDADLRSADLRSADFRDADLQNADLRSANLWGANLWGANLRGANLRGAELRDVNLWGADLRGTCIFAIASRSDGLHFFAQEKDEGLWIIAGHRYFTVKDARKHWKENRGTKLGMESLQIVKHAVAMSKIRGME